MDDYFRDMFGDITANGFFQILCHKKLKLKSKLIFEGQTYDIRAVQVLKNPESPEIEACLILV